jgi:hypothetical protein
MVALGLITGCYTYSGTEYDYRSPAGAYTYDYYPDCEVYYDVSTRVYFWSADGVWCHGPKLPRTIVIRPERRVVVRLDTAEPYRHHAEIRVHHPAPRPPAPTWAERRHVDVAVQRYRYVYYPESRVYYRSDSRTYFWQDGADAVVVNADFGHAMTKLVPNRLRRQWTDATIAKKKFSCSTFMLYLGIEGRFDNLAHHSIYVTKDYRQNLDEIENRHVLTEDPSFYIQNACVTDPSLAPAGHSTLYVLLPVSHQHPNIDWSKERDRYRQVALRQMAKLGIHDIEKRIRFERVVTPVDWENKVGIYKGATFNLAHNLGQMLHFRPQNRFEEFEGMYLVGGGTHPGSGLPVIFESAKISSRLLLEDFGIVA